MNTSHGKTQRVVFRRAAHRRTWSAGGREPHCPARQRGHPGRTTPRPNKFSSSTTTSWGFTSRKKTRTFNGSSKLRDGQRGSRRLCSVWIGWGRWKKRLAFTTKRKSKNWPSISFASTSPSSPRSRIRFNTENGRPRSRQSRALKASARTLGDH